MAGKRSQHKTSPKRSTATEADFWEAGLRAAPRADIETPNANRSRQGRYRALVWSLLILMPFMAIGYLALLPGFFQAQEAGAASTSQEAPLGKQAAMAAVSAWLEAEPNPLPGGHIISWDGVSDSEESQLVDGTNGEEILAGYEIHNFTLGTGGTAVFNSRIQVSVDETLGAQAEGTPSIEPVAPSALSETQTWPGHETTAASEDVLRAANGWVDAFTSGDPSALALATGDPDPEHAYMPLNGTTGHVNLSAGDTVVRDDGYTVARVSFTPLWDVPPAKSADGEDLDPNDAAPVTYDLLMDKADTAAPVVVAWGGPSGVDSLEPYDNAVTSIDLSGLVADNGDELAEALPEGN